MSDLINRQAATQTALEFIVEYLGGAFDEDFQRKLIERMNALPSADTSECTCCEYRVGDLCCYSDVDIKPDRPQGEWIFKTVFPNDESEFPMGYLVCSVCGSHHSNSTPCNYCDNCGARMKGTDDE